MRQLRPGLCLALLSAMIVASLTPPLAAAPLDQTAAFIAPTQITVTMYVLTNDDRSIKTDVLCESGSTEIGCTAIPGDPDL